VKSDMIYYCLTVAEENRCADKTQHKCLVEVVLEDLCCKMCIIGVSVVVKNDLDGSKVMDCNAHYFNSSLHVNFRSHRDRLAVFYITNADPVLATFDELSVPPDDDTRNINTASQDASDSKIHLIARHESIRELLHRTQLHGSEVCACM
jgi:hypothetical protein